MTSLGVPLLQPLFALRSQLPPLQHIFQTTLLNSSPAKNTAMGDYSISASLACRAHLKGREKIWVLGTGTMRRRTIKWKQYALAYIWLD